jgi:hypothetical protein
MLELPSNARVLLADPMGVGLSLTTSSVTVCLTAPIVSLPNTVAIYVF